MERTYYGKMRFIASSRVPLLIFVFFAMLFLVFYIGNAETKVLRITNQETKEEYLAVKVKESDVLTYGWTHSFEHIPWTEQYVILDNDKLLLRKITVAGFGAGIPNNKGKVTRIENGSITMDEINEEFDEINWIHSQTAMNYIKLNDRVIIDGKDLPHHTALNLRIDERVKIWQRFK